MTIDVAADKFTDPSGNNNVAATQFAYTYDTTIPTITGVTADWGSHLNAAEDNSDACPL